MRVSNVSFWASSSQERYQAYGPSAHLSMQNVIVRCRCLVSTCKQQAKIWGCMRAHYAWAQSLTGNSSGVVPALQSAWDDLGLNATAVPVSTADGLVQQLLSSSLPPGSALLLNLTGAVHSADQILGGSQYSQSIADGR